MKIVSLLVADKAEEGKRNKINIEGIFNKISAEKFPAKHKKFFVVLTTEHDTPEKVDYAVSIEKEGKIISQFQKEEEVKKRYHFIVAFNNVVFPEEGEYLVKAKVNEKILTTKLYLLKV